MTAAEFAKTHKASADWVAEMGDREFLPLSPGQRGTYAGFPARVIRHYRNAMYEIETAAHGGRACVSANHFKANDGIAYGYKV